MPVPITQTAAHAAAANATSAARHAAAAAGKHAAGAATSFANTLTHVLSEATKKIGLGSLTVSEAITIVVLLILMPFIVIYMVRLLMRGAAIPGLKSIPFMFYDPDTNAYMMVLMYEVAPNVYLTRDGRYIAIVPKHAKPINIEPLPLDKGVKRRYRYAYYGYKEGSLIIVVDKQDETYLAMPGLMEAIEREVPVRSVSDMLTYLYTANMLRIDVPVSPSLRMIRVLDPKQVSYVISKSYGRLAEEALIDVTAMTGRRKEYEQHAKMLVEMELKRVESVTGAATKVFLALVIALVVVIAVISLFGGK